MTESRPTPAYCMLAIYMYLRARPNQTCGAGSFSCAYDGRNEEEEDEICSKWLHTFSFYFRVHIWLFRVFLKGKWLEKLFWPQVHFPECLLLPAILFCLFTFLSITCHSYLSYWDEALYHWTPRHSESVDESYNVTQGRGSASPWCAPLKSQMVKPFKLRVKINMGNDFANTLYFFPN